MRHRFWRGPLRRCHERSSVMTKIDRTSYTQRLRKQQQQQRRRRRRRRNNNSFKKQHSLPLLAPSSRWCHHTGCHERSSVMTRIDRTSCTQRLRKQQQQRRRRNNNSFQKQHSLPLLAPSCRWTLPLVKLQTR